VIREDRDPAFWDSVYEHPEVKPHVSLGHEIDVAAVVSNPLVTPLRAEHGGFLFIKLDGFGRVYDLHTMFTPEGWGREALIAAKAAFREMFARGADLIVTQEVKGNRRSQPPLTFRFATAGDFGPSVLLSTPHRTWFLTRAAWDASPACRRT
jgi:hypothetical protein